MGVEGWPKLSCLVPSLLTSFTRSKRVVAVKGLGATTPFKTLPRFLLIGRQQASHCLGAAEDFSLFREPRHWCTWDAGVTLASSFITDHSLLNDANPRNGRTR